MFDSTPIGVRKPTLAKALSEVPKERPFGMRISEIQTEFDPTAIWLQYPNLTPTNGLICLCRKS